MNRRALVTALAVAPCALRGGHLAASHDVISAFREYREYEVQGVTKVNSFNISVRAMPNAQAALVLTLQEFASLDDLVFPFILSDYETVPNTRTAYDFSIRHVTGGTFMDIDDVSLLALMGARGTLQATCFYPWVDNEDDALMDDVIDTFAAWFEDLDGDLVYTTEAELEKLLPTSADLPPFISILEEAEEDA